MPGEIDIKSRVSLMGDKEYIQNTLKAGAERAHYLALKTLRKVYKKLGLYQL